MSTGQYLITILVSFSVTFVALLASFEIMRMRRDTMFCAALSFIATIATALPYPYVFSHIVLFSGLYFVKKIHVLRILIILVLLQLISFVVFNLFIWIVRLIF